VQGDLSSVRVGSSRRLRAVCDARYEFANSVS
jgi:hypothetical protein